MSKKIRVTLNGREIELLEDEPVFLLRAQDVCADSTVECWADLAQYRGASPEMVAEARQKAADMRAWPVKKVPDLPGEKK